MTAQNERVARRAPIATPDTNASQTNRIAANESGHPVVAKVDGLKVNGAKANGANVNVLEIALGYRQRGWSPIPVPYQSKGPLLDGWSNTRLSESDLAKLFPSDKKMNVGVVLGALSDGLVDVDLDCDEAVQLAPEFLPTETAIFGRKTNPSSHWLFVCTDPIPPSKQFTDGNEDGMVLELRSTGGQTVFPGSSYAGDPVRNCADRGEAIEWENNHAPIQMSAEALLLLVGTLAAAVLLLRFWQRSQRDKLATALIGTLLRAGRAPEDIDRFVEIIARAAGDEEWKKRTKSKRLKDARRLPGRPSLAALIGADATDRILSWLGVKSPSENLTDVGNGLRLVAQHGEDMRFCPQLGKWLIWDGQRWRFDDDGAVVRFAKETVSSIYRESANEQQDADRRKELAKWATRSEDIRRLNAMIESAKTELGICVHVNELDNDPWLLGVQNGTLDLRTGTLRAPSREDYITKQAATIYDSSAQCPTWLVFLVRILDGDVELIDFMQRAIGYALTGDTSEQCMFVEVGNGSNGKSTKQRCISDMLGDYAKQIAPETLMAKSHNNGSANCDVARLRGARFVGASETEDQKRFAEQAIKIMTGGDKLTARHLYQEPFEFAAQFKIFLAANHKPIIRGTDNAIWRRLRLILFNVQIPDEEKDRKLPERLRAEWPGILAWAVQGCLKWQKGGLPIPRVVEEATKEYRNESDVLRRWMDEECSLHSNARVPASELYNAYLTWAHTNCEYELTHNQFGRRLTDMGIGRGPGTPIRYVGIGLRSDTGDM